MPKTNKILTTDEPYVQSLLRGANAEAMKLFNSLIADANSVVVFHADTINVRKHALDLLKKDKGDKAVLQVYHAFRELHPTWNSGCIAKSSSHKDIYNAVVEIFKKYEEVSGIPSGVLFVPRRQLVKYRRTTTSSRGRTAVYEVINSIGSSGTDSCMIHPEKTTSITRGLCAGCYQRIRTLFNKEIIDVTTPKDAVIEILCITKSTNKKKAFIVPEAKLILETYKLKGGTA